MDNNTVYEWILHSTFTVENRAKSLYHLGPSLAPLVRPGDRVLDLCCGSGPMSFWFAEQGAQVTGVDFAPSMIGLAREEALRRNSPVEFIQADIFTHDLGRERYDLVACFGNSISDFPLADYARLVKLVHCALKPGGRFVLQYHDGYSETMQGKAARQGVYQDTPERITYRFKEYDAEAGAMVKVIRNEALREEYPRKSYLYSPPVVKLLTGVLLEPEQHILLEEAHFLDIYRRSA